MKKAVYNSKKERTKRRRKLEEKTRKEILGRKFQEENFRKKIAGRKFQEENCKGDRKRMDMDFFDLSFEESLDEQLVNAILDVGRDIRRLFEGKESQSRILMILRLHGAVTQKMLIQILHIQPGSASEILKKMEKAGLQRQTAASFSLMKLTGFHFQDRN